ncbi:uncharacterized protein BDR25DRAFT_315383 [Lindgomyces ingoldianus]|uniref:Uncharacterized protein n=1 Tax=Lindgomyces ingoldianus TaxID=673940 RepID=A0ACB6QR43_9PLEO|nr:uncharacterized protein BDR25DRAFT_315383 [Lindgomyces ingoldianus]KAF2469376.1 hypothetical protein BDR25DRAFT_315383 [Lindgomyces ingoldianus]
MSKFKPAIATCPINSFVNAYAIMQGFEPIPYKGDNLPLASLWYPASRDCVSNVMDAFYLTRIDVTDPDKNLSKVIEQSPAINCSFCLVHSNIILVFDKMTKEHDKHVETVRSYLYRVHGMGSVVKVICRGQAKAEDDRAGFYLKASQAGDMVLVVEWDY